MLLSLFKILISYPLWLCTYYQVFYVHNRTAQTQWQNIWHNYFLTKWQAESESEIIAHENK